MQITRIPNGFWKAYMIHSINTVDKLQHVGQDYEEEDREYDTIHEKTQRSLQSKLCKIQKEDREFRKRMQDAAKDHEAILALQLQLKKAQAKHREYEDVIKAHDEIAEEQIENLRVSIWPRDASQHIQCDVRVSIRYDA